MTAEELAALTALVQEEGRNTEGECVAYLRHAASLLFERTAAGELRVENEYRQAFGDCDCIVYGNALTPTKRQENFAVVWEVKAPQSPIMVRDANRNRYTPSADLIKAENQLIHYHHEARINGELKRRLQVASDDNILLGGIIIGRDTSWVRGDDPNEIERAKLSFEVRRKYFYQPHSIVMHTWDSILEYLRPAPAL